MAKKCLKCSGVNNDNAKFCFYCGNNIENDFEVADNSLLSNNYGVVSTQNMVNIDDKTGNILGIVSLITFFGTPVLMFIFGLLEALLNIPFDIFGLLFSFLPMAGIVTMIIGRVKYPNNKLLKVTMWLIIVFSVISILITIIICIIVIVTCASCFGNL